MSTHGLFEEHACPSDFYRWTADGLRTVIEHNGFAVTSIVKITAGPRAAIHLMQSALSQSLLDDRPLPLRVIWRSVSRVLLARRAWNAFLDRSFANYRVISDSNDLPFSNTYVALLVVARSSPKN